MRGREPRAGHHPGQAGPHPPHPPNQTGHPPGAQDFRHRTFRSSFKLAPASHMGARPGSPGISAAHSASGIGGEKETSSTQREVEMGGASPTAPLPAPACLHLQAHLGLTWPVTTGSPGDGGPNRAPHLEVNHAQSPESSQELLCYPPNHRHTDPLRAGDPTHWAYSHSPSRNRRGRRGGRGC